MKMDHKEVQHLAALTKIGVTEEDAFLFSNQLSAVLDGFEILNEVDTTGVLPTSQLNSLCNVMRDDTIAPSLSLTDVLGIAPQQEGEFLRSQAIFE